MDPHWLSTNRGDHLRGLQTTADTAYLFLIDLFRFHLAAPEVVESALIYSQE